MSYQTDKAKIEQQLRSLDFELRSCSKKQRHVTKRHAERALLSLKKSWSAIDPETLHVYFCSFCCGFHIGHGKGFEIDKNA